LDTIASAITTLDLHDLSRLAKTYDIKRLFVVTPLEDQQRLASRVLNHWTTGYGAQYNRDRKEAFAVTAISPSLEAAVAEIAALEGEHPLLIATDARHRDGHSISYREGGDLIVSARTVFLLFGTAWGLDRAVLEKADYILDPIMGRTAYNHLSVRTAAAIVIDRLVGRGDGQV
jgi:hypothetical protein